MEMRTVKGEVYIFDETKFVRLPYLYEHCDNRYDIHVYVNTEKAIIVSRLQYDHQYNVIVVTPASLRKFDIFNWTALSRLEQKFRKLCSCISKDSSLAMSLDTLMILDKSLIPVKYL